MKVIKIDIYYKDCFRKCWICHTEEDYTQFMKWYDFDPENNNVIAKRNDNLELDYFYPITPMQGKENDDKDLEIEMVIVDKNWEMWK